MRPGKRKELATSTLNAISQMADMADILTSAKLRLLGEILPVRPPKSFTILEFAKSSGLTRPGAENALLKGVRSGALKRAQIYDFSSGLRRKVYVYWEAKPVVDKRRG